MRHGPDFNCLRKALLREGEQKQVPSWELFVDIETIQNILGKILIKPTDASSTDQYLDQMLEFQLMMGYDYLPIIIEPPLPKENFLIGKDTAELSKDKRIWVDEHHGMINNWEDFEKYPWKEPSSISYLILEKAIKKVPDGMKVMVWTSGILENVQWLMGYEPMSYATVDNPELIEALFEKIGKLVSSIFINASQMMNVGVLVMGDDMGYKSGTLFSPDFLRKYVFPWQKRCVEAAHSNKLPFVLHSCGNLKTVMDDLINDVGIDAKHSYEDVILTVEEAKQLYGERIAIVGGIDMDFLARSTEEEVRKRVRRTLDRCAPGGGYVMGSGNSIANYIPIKNYMAMMDEVKKYG